MFHQDVLMKSERTHKREATSGGLGAQGPEGGGGNIAEAVNKTRAGRTEELQRRENGTMAGSLK